MEFQLIRSLKKEEQFEKVYFIIMYLLIGNSGDPLEQLS